MGTSPTMCLSLCPLPRSALPSCWVAPMLTLGPSWYRPGSHPLPGTWSCHSRGSGSAPLILIPFALPRCSEIWTLWGLNYRPLHLISIKGPHTCPAAEAHELGALCYHGREAQGPAVAPGWRRVARPPTPTMGSTPEPLGVGPKSKMGGERESCLGRDVETKGVEQKQL